MPHTTTRSPHRPGLGRRLAGLFAVALVAMLTIAVVAGCGSGSSSDDTSASPSPGDTGAAATAPSELRIAYQLIPNGDLIVKNEGWLEAALPDTTITWVKFDSGADVNTAILAGSIDIGLAGSSAVTKGLCPPLDIQYKVPWIFDAIGTAESLVAKNDSGVTTIADLAGKKVGTPFGSTAHYSLLAALEDAGVDPAKVTIVDLQPPDILAAWERGDIAAAYVWNPTLSELRKDGTTLISSADLAAKGKLTADLAIVTNDFAETYPDAVQTWLDQQNKAVALYKSDPDAAATAVAAQLNLTPEEALAQMKELILLDATEQAAEQYLGAPGAPGALADNLLAAAEFLKGQGQIDSVPPLATFQEALANQFTAQAAGQ